jgi:diguanylate cyclase (GGDEF)-like protein
MLVEGLLDAPNRPTWEQMRLHSETDSVAMTAPVSVTPERRRSTAQGPERTSNVIWAIYAVLAVLLIAYVVWQLFRSKDAYSQALDGWGIAAFEIVATGMCFLRALVTKRGRTVILVLGGGLLAWSLGDLALAWETAAGSVPSPSIADAFYLCFYPLTYVALMLLVRRQVRKFSFATWLDGGIAGLGAAAVCAAFAFHNLMHTAGLSALGTATNVVYPVGDLLLLAMVVGGTAVLPGRNRAPWLMLATGYVFQAVGDTFNLFGSSIGGTHAGVVLNAIAWPVSILVISASVWVRQHPGDRLGHETAPGFVLPGFAAAAALAILFIGSLQSIGHAALGLAAATLIAAGIRSAMSLSSLRTLTESRRRQAVTDQLTGLGNRRALLALLDEFFAEQADPDAVPRTLAFLFVDLTGFKEVNDSFGHPAGDELLRQLGNRLKDSLRTQDLFVRFGGDEFAVALLDANADYAATVAARLTSRLEEPFMLDAVRAKISASIGIAVVPTDANDTGDLMRCADLAMYRAKLAGKCFAIYQEDLDGVGNRMRLVEELRDAILERELELHYQPQVDLISGEIVAVEALIRWQHPRLGYIPPLEFLPLAEEAGLMSQLTTLGLDTALGQCAQWRSEGQVVTVSVNISATSLVDVDFPDLVEQLLESHDLPPQALVLELTETTAIGDFERSKQTIQRLRDLGVIVSVDDFGAGVTSLAYLSSLAVGELKLDRSFITELGTADADRVTALIRSTIDLAHSLGLRVVAEGVEERSSLDLLSTLGCDLAQGYLISKPKPAHEVPLQSADTVIGAATSSPLLMAHDETVGV